MFTIPFANLLWEQTGDRTVLHAMPVMLVVLLVLALAYRYYSAFLAAKVAALDGARPTPAHRFYDGQNYHPTNKWVLFGHHFAAISGAGPLIGPVLAIQYGYMPGLLWLLTGVCLAGAVQDMLVLAASVRRDGKSLAEIARGELGTWAQVVVSAAILFIVVIALAGLGFVVVKALGGDDVNLPKTTEILLPEGQSPTLKVTDAETLVEFPRGCQIRYRPDGPHNPRPESFTVRIPKGTEQATGPGPTVRPPPGSVMVLPGSSWGVFTIACTIPIALFVGLYMYKIRKGRVVEASLLGALGVLAATVAGNWIPGSPLEKFFSLSKEHTILALAAYGFIASVLPVWLLLCPRDYLSSFLKIGTIALLVVGVVVANPRLEHPPLNEVFLAGGPTFQGHLFPFVFICVMCGAVSGFHSLVSSGTTPKMVDKESHIRPIGYGAMLIEGLVGVVALVAAASLDPKIYYAINVDLSREEQFRPQVDRLIEMLGVGDLPHLDLAQIEEQVGGESLRGRTGGAVTLAVGMAQILTRPLSQLGLPAHDLMKYWYHFAIMFEALFILTTIDTGTRIARFLLQEALGKLHPKFEKTDWLPGAVLSTAVVTAAYSLLIATGSISTIWPMFGIANQLLAVVALCLVTTLLVNTGRGRYAPVTLLPMLFVTATTLTAGTQLVTTQFPAMIQRGLFWTGVLNIGLTVFVIACVGTLLLLAASRWVAVLNGMVPTRKTAEAET